MIQVATANAVQDKHRQSGSEGEAIYQLKGMSASYLHFYFPSNPAATADLFLPRRN